MTKREATSAVRIRWRGAHIHPRSRILMNGLGESLEKPQTCEICALAGRTDSGAPACRNCFLGEVFPAVALSARNGADAACSSLFYRIKAVPRSVESEVKYIFRHIEEHLDRMAQIEMFGKEGK